MQVHHLSACNTAQWLVNLLRLSLSSTAQLAWQIVMSAAMLVACGMLSMEQPLVEGQVFERRAPGSRHQRGLWHSMSAMTLLVLTQTLPQIYTAVRHPPCTGSSPVHVIQVRNVQHAARPLCAAAILLRLAW